MKYKVIGWTEYDDISFREGRNTDAAVNAIIDDIKANGYCFSGYAHQEMTCGAPILNDGKIRRFGQRDWGAVMARAHGRMRYMDYSNYAFSFGYGEEELPDFEKWISTDNLNVETELNETFTIEVSDAEFDKLSGGGEFETDDTTALRFADVGDTLVLKCADRAFSYKIAHLARGWTLRLKAKEKTVYIQEMWQLLYGGNAKENAAAEEAYERGTTRILFTLEKIN